LAEVAAARSGVDRATVLHALSDTVPPDDDALVVLARTVELLRNEVAHAR
jgi:hypothetical protein